MDNRRQMGVVAAVATLFAAAPLWSIFERSTWLLQCLLAVALIAGAATLARTGRWPVWGQVGAGVVALLFALTWMFPSHGEFIAIIPSPQTFEHFGELLRQSGTAIRDQGVPVPDGDPLLFLAVLGIGFVAICVDLFAVGLRRPALAGLPMLAIYSVPVAVYADSVPIFPFMVGACGFMWLLVADNVDRVRRFGRRFTGEGHDVGAWEPSPLAAAGRRLAVLGVVLAVALPLAIPGMTTGLIDRFGTAGGGGGGGTGPGRGGNGSSVDLFANLAGSLRQNGTEELLRVRTNERDPFYLRFGVAERLTAAGFAALQPTGRQASKSLPSNVPQAPGVSQTRYHATVKVTGLNMNLLPVFTQPVNLRGVGSNWYYDDSMQVIFSNRSHSKGEEYSFDYVRSEFSPAGLTAAKGLASNGVPRRYTEVPPVPAIQDKVAELTRGKQTVYDKVLAIFNFFSHENGFSYSLETQPGTSGSAIVDFLNNKEGFCEQYAAAMAWLVRADGIPARVAFGFTRGDQTDGDFAVLTNKNLHAWTEVFFQGIGWVPFDPTPASSVPGATDPAWASNPDAPPASTNTPGSPGNEAGAAPGTGSAGDPELHDPFADKPAGAPSIEPNASNWVWWTLGLAVLALALLGLPAMRRRLLRRRRQKFRATRPVGAAASGTAVAGGMVAADPASGDREILVIGDSVAAARADAHAAWDELLDTMIDFRLTVEPTETPRATAERLVRTERLAEPAAEAVRLLGRAEERARYARNPLGSEQLVNSLRAVRRAFSRQAPWRTRFIAVLMPPSILSRWKTAVVEGATLAMTTLSRWQEAISPRSISPRKLRPRRG